MRLVFRNVLGLAIHPETGDLWEHENGPLGGDEINVIKPGRNYGWPIVSYGRAYSGDLTGDSSGPLTTEHTAPGFEAPFLFWVPSIAPSGYLLTDETHGALLRLEPVDTEERPAEGGPVRRHQ